MNILDSLKNQRNNLIKEQCTLKENIGKLVQKNTEIDLKIKDLDVKIKKEKQVPKISDHAVIRFLERKYNIEFEDVRKEIMTNNLREAIESGCTKYKSNGFEYIIKEKTVITILG